MRNFFLTTILSGLLLLVAGPFQKAEALTVQDVTLGGEYASKFWGPGQFDGKDSSLAEELNKTTYFSDFGGSDVFEFFGKVEMKAPTGEYESHFGITLSLFYTRDATPQNEGDFTLSWSGEPLPVTMDLVFLLKSNLDYALYFFDDFRLTKDPYSAAGTYSVQFAANKNEKFPELSHLSVFGRLEPSQPVPEPATLLLFGTGILGIAGLARRRKR